MDPLTRHEADKIEGVLADLVADLEMISFLPADFNLWLRDDAPALVDKFEAHQLADIIAAGGAEAVHPAAPTATAAATAEREEALEELQQLCKASCFLHAAAAYGDPADNVGNEALQQLSEFCDVERGLAETAATIGHLDDEEVDLHHLSLRAVLDTLRDGGYHTRMRTILQGLFPARDDDDDSDRGGSSCSDSSSTSSPDLAAEAEGGAADAAGKGYEADGRRVSAGSPVCAADPPQQQQQKCGGGRFSRKSAVAADLVSEPLDAFTDTVRTLARLMRLRNASTVNEDIQRYKVLHEAVNKEQSATADVQALNRTFTAVKAARRREVAALDEEVERLEAEIAYVKRAADVELEAMNEVNEKVRADRAGTYRHQLEQHRQASVLLEQRFRQLEAQHVEEAGALRTARAKREAAVSDATAEYDAQMASMQTAMRALNKASMQDTERIVALEETIERLATEQREHEWELKVVDQRQGHLLGLRHQQEQDARVLQAYVRAFAVRAEVEKEMAAKNKKKRKKGSAKKR